jgi:hypothetical protein
VTDPLLAAEARYFPIQSFYGVIYITKESRLQEKFPGAAANCIICSFQQPVFGQTGRRVVKWAE